MGEPSLASSSSLVPIFVLSASRSSSSRAAHPCHCHHLLLCSLLREVTVATSWGSWLCLMPPRADIRLLLQKGRAEHPLLPGTFSVEGSVIPSCIPGHPGREDLPSFTSFTCTSFQAKDSSGFFPWCCREEQGKHDLLHGCIYKSVHYSCWEEQAVPEAPSLHHMGTLLTFSFWKLLMLKDRNIPLPFLDKNVAHCLVW